jgi:hypothetical protein
VEAVLQTIFFHNRKASLLCKYSTSEIYKRPSGGISAQNAADETRDGQLILGTLELCAREIVDPNSKPFYMRSYGILGAII